ncbi:MAG TPA: hypothetical protein VKM72_01940 [Thermoanaerobaculia bacterium]|nr:hypothetical protein [Thermoanaerobaculia bacterium]
MIGPQRADVETIDALITTLYETITGPAGPRDWDRERHIFAPSARLMPTRFAEDGSHSIQILDNEGYITSRTPFFQKTSFYEKEVSRREERFGKIAHVWSAYEGRYTPDGEVVLRGVNSFQLYHDGDRWWVVSMLWDNERTGIPLPA